MQSDSMSLPSTCNNMNMTCSTPTPANEYSTPETPLAPRPSYTFRSIQQSDAVELCLPNQQLDLSARRPLVRRSRAAVSSSSSSMSHYARYQYEYGGVGQSSPVGVTDLSMPCLDDDDSDDDDDDHEDQHNTYEEKEPELMTTVPRVSLRMRPMTRDIAIGLFPELDGGELEQRRVYHHDGSNNSSIPLSFRPLALPLSSKSNDEDRCVATSTPTPPCFLPALVSTPHSPDGQSYEFYEQGELTDAACAVHYHHQEEEALIHMLPKELDLALPQMEEEEDDSITIVEEDDDEDFLVSPRSHQQGAPLCRCSSVVQLTATECTIRRTASAPALHHHMTKRTRSSSMSNKPDCFVFPLYRQMQRLFDGVCVAFS
mmetsp:Transcript_6844/g.10054  ORF Transcript_6844/g.10054 Transcript_6844/m.10054 type:complete len:372 (-) Transcript_6844:379-1494(-)